MDWCHLIVNNRKLHQLLLWYILGRDFELSLVCTTMRMQTKKKNSLFNYLHRATGNLLCYQNHWKRNIIKSEPPSNMQQCWSSIWIYLLLNKVCLFSIIKFFSMFFVSCLIFNLIHIFLLSYFVF